jgi:hypothetical protein
MSRRLRVLGERKEVPNKAATIFQAENDFIVEFHFGILELNTCHQ